MDNQNITISLDQLKLLLSNPITIQKSLSSLNRISEAPQDTSKELLKIVSFIDDQFEEGNLETNQADYLEQMQFLNEQIFELKEQISQLRLDNEQLKQNEQNLINQINEMTQVQNLLVIENMNLSDSLQQQQYNDNNATDTSQQSTFRNLGKSGIKLKRIPINSGVQKIKLNSSKLFY